MPQIEINDKTFKVAESRAAAGGYSSVAEYVTDLVKDDSGDEAADLTPNLDHLFTPERLAQIEEAESQIRSGKFFTSQQVEEHFKQKRAAGMQKDAMR